MNQVMHFLTEHLFDYAGLFPPAKLSLTQALSNFFKYQNHPYQTMLGKFILPIQKHMEYLSLTKRHQESIPLSVILSSPSSVSMIDQTLQKDCQNLETIHDQSRISSIDSFEIVFSHEFYDQEELALQEHFQKIFAFLSNAVEKECDFFCEIPYLDNKTLNNFFSFVQKFNLQNQSNKISIKLRTGGVTPDLVPSAETLSSILFLLGKYKLPFKVTAGLHIPVPNYNKAVGTKMHGFLNVLLGGMLSFLRSDTNPDFSHELVSQELLHSILEKLHYTHLKVENSLIYVSTPNNTQQKFIFTSDMVKNFRKKHFKGIGTCDFLEPIEYLNSEIPFLA